VLHQTVADPISRAYLRLSFHIECFVPGFIDAYFGPPEWKTEAETEGDMSLADLRRTAEALLRDIASIPDELRREWLTKQVTAMIASLRRVQGETLPFRRLYKKPTICYTANSRGLLLWPTCGPMPCCKASGIAFIHPSMAKL
jgi:hypothetical protein